MPLPPAPAGMDQRAAPYETLRRGEFVVENNTWGAFQVSAYEQCVFASAGDAPAPTFGWAWDYPTERPDETKAYPEVIHGKKPWAWTSTTSRLPRPVRPLPSVRIEFDARTQGTGRFNAAFSLWFTRTAVAAGEPDVSHEVMLWVGQHGGPVPAGSRLGPVTIKDGRAADLWAGRVKTWDTFAFVFHRPVTAGVIECGYYLDHLVQAGRLPAGVFLASVEFGNEIWHGTGRTLLEKYRVTVGDGPPPDPVPDPDRAYLRLDVPERAQVFIQGSRMQSTAPRRVFRSPPIAAGREYTYRVRVVVDGPSGPKWDEREIQVRPGTVTDASFADLERK